MDKVDELYDVIIIGSGAGGGTLAHHLATRSDARILLLERGDFLPKEKNNWNSQSVFVDQIYNSQETWFDKNKKPFSPGIHYFVGGNTKFYGAALMRMREKDFGEIVHEDGISEAWPINYQDLKPYYLQAENLYRVHGKRGSDPFEPEEKTPYPCPAVKHEPRIQELFNDFCKTGHKPFPLPLGILLNESNRHDSPCIKCNTCDGFPCLIDAKSDAEVIAVNPALKSSSNITLLTNRYVQTLESNPMKDKVTAIKAIHQGKEERYRGKIIVVSCGAINSAALLLRSQIANSSGVVGRHYMCHNNSAFMALSKKKNPTHFQKTIGLTDYYFGADDFNYPLGLIQMLGKSDATMLKGDAPWFTPNLLLSKIAEHSIDFWLTTEDLARKENRVIVDDSGKIHLQYTENNLKAHKKLIQKLKAMLGKIGCYDRLMPTSFYLKKKIPIAGVAHQNGTVRFGNDPKTSALNPLCQAHDVENLYVVDGSFFVSSTSVNPALTIMANALRVGDHLLKVLNVSVKSSVKIVSGTY